MFDIPYTRRLANAPGRLRTQNEVNGKNNPKRHDLAKIAEAAEKAKKEAEEAKTTTADLNRTPKQRIPYASMDKDGGKSNSQDGQYLPSSKRRKHSMMSDNVGSPLAMISPLMNSRASHYHQTEHGMNAQSFQGFGGSMQSMGYSPGDFAARSSNHETFNQGAPCSFPSMHGHLKTLRAREAPYTMSQSPQTQTRLAFDFSKPPPRFTMQLQSEQGAAKTMESQASQMVAGPSNPFENGHANLHETPHINSHPSSAAQISYQQSIPSTPASNNSTTPVDRIPGVDLEDVDFELGAANSIRIAISHPGYASGDFFGMVDAHMPSNMSVGASHQINNGQDVFSINHFGSDEKQS